MIKDTFQLSNDAAKIYESQKVPAIFLPLAEATLNQTHLTKHDEVLDLACGTGILMRLIGLKIPDIKRLVGVDLNESMLQVAQELTAESDFICEWKQADVISLPFAKNEFSLCLCQQGLQYFPDKPTALSEIHRVLKPQGRLVLTLWSRISPLFATLAQALQRYTNEDIAERSLAPFSFRSHLVIVNLLREAGFTHITASEISIDRKIGPAGTSIPLEIFGNPVGEDVKKLGDAVLQNIVEYVEQSLSSYRSENGFVVPQHSHLFEALAEN